MRGKKNEGEKGGMKKRKRKESKRKGTQKEVEGKGKGSIKREKWRKGKKKK